MEFTSERIIPEYYSENFSEFMLYLMHIKSYLVLENIVHGKVLDYGCGLGYGSKILSNFCDKVYGIDIDKNAIVFAKENFYAKNIEFQLLDKDYKKLPFEDMYFDYVVSFQVFEHIIDIDKYLKEINRVLKPDGYFICTTPNARMRLYPYQKSWNQHHIREYNSYELKRIINSYFDIYSLKGIRLTPFYQKLENKRVWIRKSLMYPFSNKLVSERIRRRILKYIWHKTVYKKQRKQKTVYNNHTYIDNVIIDNDVQRCSSFFLVVKKKNS